MVELKFFDSCLNCFFFWLVDKKNFINMFFYVYRFKKFKLFFVGKICGEKGGF